MKTVTLTRLSSSDMGTEGVLKFDNFELKTLELPWRENKKQVSCIPKCEYICELTQSPKFGQVYTVKDVAGRGNILIHSGNFAGDKSKGYKSDVEGCILLGLSHNYIGGQRCVLCSRDAVRNFINVMKGEQFKLIIC